MNILIFYASYGGGHFSAANAIKNYLETTYKNSDLEINVKIIDFMKYINTGIEKLTTNAYKVMAKDAPKTWGVVYKLSDSGPIYHISNFNNKVMSMKLNSLFKKFNPDLVISTHPFSTQMTANLKKLNLTSCKLASIMTDYVSQNQWLVGNKYIDYIFVATSKMRDEVVSKGVDESKVFDTGIPVLEDFYKHYNKDAIFKELQLNPSKKHILFFGGGEFRAR